MKKAALPPGDAAFFHTFVIYFPLFTLVFVRSNFFIGRVRVSDVEPRLVEALAGK